MVKEELLGRKKSAQKDDLHTEDTENTGNSGDTEFVCQDQDFS